MARTSSPCAACKFLRRRCSSDCIFAPYFPLDQTQKFINLHKVYGTSNVQKLLAELPVDRRQDAVNSLAYEAETRIQDPVYGCVGPIVFLKYRVKNLNIVLQDAYKELAAYQDAVLQTQQAMGVADSRAAQPMPDMMHPLGVNPLFASSPSNPYNMASVMGIPTRGSSLEIHEPSSQSNNNINTFHPAQLVMPTAPVGMEQRQENIRAFQLRQHGQDFRFDRGRGINLGAGSSTGVGVVRFSQNNLPQQSNNNATTLHPEQLVMPTATIGTEQQETTRAFQLQQQGQDVRINGGQRFDVGIWSSRGVGEVGFSLKDPGQQSNSNNNTLHSEQHDMPTATIGTEQLQEIICDFELQQQGQDVRFDGGQGFDVGTWSSSGVGEVGFSLNDPGPQSNNNTTLLSEQPFMLIATIGTGQQQEIISDFELQQQGQDVRFDDGRGFDFRTRSSCGVGEVGFSLNDPGPQSNNNNIILSKQPFMPTPTIGTRQQQEIISDFELQQLGQDVRFDGSQGFDFLTRSSCGVGEVGFSLNDPGPQSNNNNTLLSRQPFMPTATIETGQIQKIISDLELQQQGQDVWFDDGQGFDVGTWSSSGVGDVGISLNDPGQQSNNNINTFHPEQLVKPIAAVGSEQQETFRAFELPKHSQDIRFDDGQGFDVGTWRSCGVGEVGFSLNDPCPQSNNNNNLLHPEQHVMPVATIGTQELPEIICDFELQQQGQDVRFDGDQGFVVGTWSSSGVGEVGFSLNDPGPQSNNNNNTLHPEQHDMPTATIRTGQQQEIISDFELLQHSRDFRFDGGQGFDVGTWSSCGVGEVGFSLNDPGPQSNNNTLLSEQPFMPTATIGTEQIQEINSDFELQQQGQDVQFEGGQSFDVGTWSSSGVGDVGINLNHPGQQSNNSINTFHPGQLVMPIAAIGSEQQEILRAFELPQQSQDVRFDGGQGFNVGTWSSCGVGEVGFSLNDPGLQSSNNDNTLHPEQLVMPTATIGTGQQQEIISDFELQQQGQDVRFDGGQGFDVGTGSSSGVGDVGISLNDLGRQRSNNINTFHPEQLVMPIAAVGSEQQATFTAFELPQNSQDVWFDGCQGFDVGTWSSCGVGEVGFSLNDPVPQSNNNNSTCHPEQPFMPSATVATEQLQEIFSAFELQQQGQDIGFDWGQGLDVGTGSCSGVGVVGFSLNYPGPQINDNNNTLHPEQPIATVGSEQEETFRAFELQQHWQDIMFDGGQDFNVGAGSSNGVGVVEFSPNNPPSALQVSPHPMLGSSESEFSHPHFQPQLSSRPQQVVAVQEHHTQELESQEEWLQEQNVGNCELKR